MKTHYAEELDEASQPNETAEEHVWHEHRLAPTSPVSNVAAVALLAAAFIALVKLNSPAVPTPVLPELSAIASGTADIAAPQLGDDRER